MEELARRGILSEFLVSAGTATRALREASRNGISPDEAKRRRSLGRLHCQCHESLKLQLEMLEEERKGPTNWDTWDEKFEREESLKAALRRCELEAKATKEIWWPTADGDLRMKWEKIWYPDGRLSPSEKFFFCIGVAICVVLGGLIGLPILLFFAPFLLACCLICWAKRLSGS